MCGRYSITSPPEAMRGLFKFHNRPNLAPRFNVAPTQEVPIVRASEGTRELVLARWGLIPSWAKDATIGPKCINARSETVAEKPAFRQAYAKRRCLVAADGYYEWQVIDAKTKQPWRFTLKDGGPFGFAGLWETWRAPEGNVVLSCSILTTAPNELAGTVHDRMPLILPPDAYERWLGEKPAGNLAELLAPYPARDMRAYRVGKLVGNPRNDVPECIRPID